VLFTANKQSKLNWIQFAKCTKWQNWNELQTGL